MKLEDITPEMQKAGDDMASLLISANICQTMSGLGGCETLEYLLMGKDARTIEIVNAYLNEKAEPVTCIFLAMEDKRKVVEPSRFKNVVIERIQKALRDDAAGNSKCTMTDLDFAVEMLQELILINKGNNET